MKPVVLGLIAWYQRWISPLFPSCCRFYPTCSAYTMEAVRRFGAAKGCWLGLLRVLRCNPLFKGGVDPVPDRFHWVPKRDRE